jgi:hypothetical protein
MYFWEGHPCAPSGQRTAADRMNTTQTQIDNPTRPPPGRPPRQPSGRNLELYHELVYERRRQAEVASCFRVSRPRIAQLRRQMAAWVDAMLPDFVVSHFQATDPGNRFHLAIAFRRALLTEAYQTQNKVRIIPRSRFKCYYARRRRLPHATTQLTPPPALKTSTSPLHPLQKSNATAIILIANAYA